MGETFYEKSDASAKGIFITAVAGLLVGILIFLGLWWMFLVYKREIIHAQHPRTAISHAAELPPAPRLQLNPAEDLKEYRQEKAKILNSLGWAEKSGEWAHIPIEDAMKLLVQEREKKGVRQ